MSHKPPLSRAEKISRTEASLHVTTGNIAAIDFGTTSVSLAYTTSGNKDVQTLPLDNEKSTRVSNAVLFKREGRSITITAFGNHARKKFSSMRPSDYAGYIYFERIKMLLAREKTTTRQSVVESFSGEEFYLIEVIAFILQHLKDQLIDHLSRTVTQLKTTDFDWVITVPAIWDARGKRMMREAAYLAGLLTESSGITQFTPVTAGGELLVPNEANPERLSLALEPEAAALYSQEMVSKEIEEAGDKAAIERPSQYMVIDIGGGTVDITAHIERDGGIVVENIPTGNDWGGTKINEAFSNLLQELVSDREYRNFLGASGDHSQQMAALNKILYLEFENQKLLFGKCKSDEIAITLSSKFCKCYGKLLEDEAKKNHGIEVDDEELWISQSLVESKLFGPAIDGIISCTLKAIEENEFKVNTFYLVGGFGGCKYVYEKLKAAIEKLYQSKGLVCNVVIPQSPTIAVAQGAVMWRRDPERMKARRADATYGVAISTTFDPAIHDRHYEKFNEEGKRRCNSIFKVFLEKGELASTENVFFTTLKPSKQHDTKFVCPILSTPNIGVQYIEDKNGKNTVNKIGTLIIDIPNPNNLPRDKRKVDIMIDFSGTEIQAKAKYRVTGEEVKTVCDFLSANN